MDYLKSLANVNDMADRIDNIHLPENQKFIRGMVSGVGKSGPLCVVTKMAKCMLEIRKQELRETSESN